MCGVAFHSDHPIDLSCLAGQFAGFPMQFSRRRPQFPHLSRGESHEEIGNALGISIETVRTHLRKACDKLGASTRTQAVASALRSGLID